METVSSFVMPQFDMLSQMPMVMPVMVPAPTYMPTFEELKQGHNESPASEQHFINPAILSNAHNDDGYNLFLCKDDFEPYSENQAEYLKKFLVAQIIKVSEAGHGWSPDFTLKGIDQHRHYRYELVTRDEITKNWILNLDFSEFRLFNVLVYTKEELWYERAAIWLPGHSRCRNIEPLDKLKLQNRHLEDINVGKWKFVKKIVTVKGTRVYVDMPPSSARALEKKNMLLSYELQKVNVFLKSVAVDKNAFDSGLKEISVKDPSEIIEAVKNSPMPSLGHDSNIVKIGLKGNKLLNLEQARKIKEMIIFHIYKYQQQYHRPCKTDFSKFGFCLPGYFGVVPENTESRRWLLAQNIGRLNKHAVVVLGAEENLSKYIKMTVYVKTESKLNLPLIMERLKQGNQGVKGLNFNLWKPLRLENCRERGKSKTKFIVEMDLESVETLSKMKYELDYLDDRQNYTVTAKYEQSHTALEDLIKKYKAEMNDTYDVANMDIASSSEEDDDIIYVGKL